MRRFALQDVPSYTSSYATLTEMCDECESGEYAGEFYIAPCVKLKW